MGPTGRLSVLQIHPTRRCNLRCLHCYSASAPEERDALSVSLLQGAVTDAASEGYTVASLSGGEPLLYRPLRPLLMHAKACGMATTVTTNGMLLDERRLAVLDGVTDLIAISIDGTPKSHNRIRGTTRAFDKMSARLDGLRASGIPFGFIFTLTQYNLHELEWVAQFALTQGAKLLQVHPLEEVGRAASTMRGERPDGLEASFAYIEAARIQRVVGSELFVQVDLVHRGALGESPERVYASLQEQAAQRPLAELVSPLVIEADGSVVPLQYGFARAYALGNLQDAPLRDLAQSWRKGRLHTFRALCRRVHEASCKEPMDKPRPAGGSSGEIERSQGEASQFPFFNWYEAVTQMSQGSID